MSNQIGITITQSMDSVSKVRAMKVSSNGAALTFTISQWSGTAPTGGNVQLYARQIVNGVPNNYQSIGWDGKMQIINHSGWQDGDTTSVWPVPEDYFTTPYFPLDSLTEWSILPQYGMVGGSTPTSTDLTVATTFVPVGSSAQVTLSNVVIDSSGTTGTITIMINAPAPAETTIEVTPWLDPISKVQAMLVSAIGGNGDGAFTISNWSGSTPSGGNVQLYIRMVDNGNAAQYQRLGWDGVTQIVNNSGWIYGEPAPVWPEADSHFPTPYFPVGNGIQWSILPQYGSVGGSLPTSTGLTVTANSIPAGESSTVTLSNVINGSGTTGTIIVTLNTEQIAE